MLKHLQENVSKNQELFEQRPRKLRFQSQEREQGLANSHPSLVAMKAVTGSHNKIKKFRKKKNR